jgi:choline dehydrogenase-like flavoprotein
MRAAMHGQHMQARRAFFAAKSGDFLVNDRENPYRNPRDAYYLWIRGRVLGGRLHTYGRMLLRMSDYDFKSASRDGHGTDWPISYGDLAPYYDRVEEFIGIYGQNDGLPQLPDGHYVGASQLLHLEQDFKVKVESAWPEHGGSPRPTCTGSRLGSWPPVGPAGSPSRPTPSSAASLSTPTLSGPTGCCTLTA